MAALTHTPPTPLARLSAFAQLGKLRVYQHFYEWLLVVALLVHHRVDRPGMWLALTAALLAMFALQACAFYAFFDRIQNLRHPKRLEDEVGRTGAQGGDGGVQISKRGDENHLAAKALVPQLAQPGHAVFAGQ